MIIRPMRPDDLPGVMEIAASLPEAPHWPQNVYTQALHPGATPSRIALVAEYPDAPIAGFLLALLIPPQAELETIAVASHAQRQGIGRLLLSFMFTALKETRITEVMLEVRQSNRPARAFYAAAGFAETGIRPGYYSDPKEDAVLLSRPVSSSLDLARPLKNE